MASTVLPNGIIIPEKYSRDWYNDLYHNWQELDNLLGGGTPKDGTLTIQKNGTAVGTFSANQATDETINIEVPDVNDGTLTIQQNGTTVDSFSANSSSDKTVNIQCVDLNSNQTIAGNKEFTGTTTAHDLVPSATETYNFGSSTAQWNNAYAKNYFYNGTAWGLDKANTWSNINAYQREICLSGGRNAYISPMWTGVGSGIAFLVQDASKAINFGVWTDDTNNDNRKIVDDTKGRIVIFVGAKNGENYVELGPREGGNAQLGTSTNKWKSFNGVNPGALSLPSGTVGMNVIGDVSVVGTEKKLSKNITITGFVYVDVSFTSSNRLNLYNDTKKYGIWLPCDSGRIRQIMPISAGDRLEFNVLDAGSTINAIQIFTCQGNV